MEISGKSSNCRFFTFKYPGRELLTTEALLHQRQELQQLYVYDATLTTGSLMYSCAGGIGITKEPFVVDMHKFIGMPYCVKVLRSTFREDFGERYTKARYFLVRERFNEKALFSLSQIWSARLYLLWGGSGFDQRYKRRGYNASYSPTFVDYDGLAEASRRSREKNLLFRKEDFHTMSESILNDNVFLHAYFPAEYGVYGAGFKWSRDTLADYVRAINELGSFGHKVCVSALFERRGRIFRDYRKLFPGFSDIVIPGFKVSELIATPSFSEMHLFNF